MKYIIGNGITALIVAVFNPEFKVIAKKGGGFTATKYGKASVFIQNHKETRLLLNMLNVNYSVKIVNIKYYKNNEKIQPTNADKIKIISKKLLDLKTQKSLDIDDKIFITDIKLAEESEKGTLSILKVEMKEIITALNYKLLSEKRIIYDDIFEINDKFIRGIKNPYLYEQIINTLPAYQFWDLYENKLTKPNNFPNIDITAVASKESPGKIFSLEREILYFIDKLYSKVIYDDKEELYYYEFSGNLTKKDLKKLGFNKKIEFIEVHKSKRIGKCYGNIAPKNIIFMGRYAEWDEDFRIDTTIKRCLDKYPLHEIWSSQKIFNQQFVDFKNDIQYKQKITKDYILHLMSEMDELLRTINWKLNSKEEKKINFEHFEEEWIDMYKYWLSIGIIWGISPEDFEKAYWKKTNKLNGDK